MIYLSAYLRLYLGVAVWVLVDSKSRQYPGVVWAGLTLIVGPLIPPFYLTKRPLKSGEVRTGGMPWNLAKYFALFWTATLAAVFVADLSRNLDYVHTAVAAHESTLAFVAMAGNSIAGREIATAMEDYARRHTEVGFTSLCPARGNVKLGPEMACGPNCKEDLTPHDLIFKNPTTIDSI